MNKCLYALVCICVGLLSPVKAKAQPNADFTSSITSGCSPILVQFSDLSTGSPTSWYWDLGNGTISTLQNPSTTYIAPGTYTVTLIATNAGGSNTKTVTNYINVIPSPTVNFVSSDSGMSCPPKTVQFTNLSNPGSGGAVSYFWDFGDGSTSTVANPTHTYAATGNYSVTLNVTNNFGCSKVLTKTNYIQLVNNIVSDFTSADNNSCTSPATVNFTNNSTGGGVPLLWIFGDGGTSTAVNPAHTYTSSGSYNVTLIAISPAGCTDTTTKAAFVNIGSLTPSFSMSAVNTCTNNNVNFTNTSLPGAGNSTWYFGDGSSATGTNTSHSYSAPGTYSIKLVVNYNNCSDSISQTVTVNQGPVPAFSATATQNCMVPFTTTFNNNSSGATSYLWIFGDGSTSTATNPTHTYTTLGQYTVTLVAFGSNGCSDTFVQNNYINLNYPAVWVGPSGAYCLPATINFQSYTNSTLPISNFVWDFGDGTIASGGSSATHTYSTPGTYVVTVNYSAGPGCNYTSGSSTVTISAPPTAAFTANPMVVCPNQPITFNNGSNGATTYTWQFGDGNTSAQANPTHFYGAAGTYTVTLIASNNGCVDTMTASIVVSLPSADFVPVFNCNNKLQLTFQDQSLGADTYSWDFGDGNTSNLQSPTHTYASLGTYTVTLTVTNAASGCTSVYPYTLLLYDVAAVFNADDTTVCKGQPVIFTSPVTPLSYLVTSYTWDFGDGSPQQTVSGNTTAHVYGSPGVYTVHLVIQDERGCYDTLIRSNYITVSGPNANFTGIPVTGCSPLTVNFTNQSTSVGSPIVSNMWSFGDGTSLAAPVTNVAHIYTTGTYTVSLTVTDANGCVDSQVRLNYITANKPTANFNASATTICPGQSVNFAPSTAPNLTYSWSFGDGGTSTAVSPAHIYTTTGTYTVILVVTDGQGCTDTLVKPNYINVGGINLSFQASDTFAACPPLTVNFTNTSTNVSTYTWTFGNGNSSSILNPSTIYTMPGIYTVQLKGQNGSCMDSVTKTITLLGPTGTLSYTPLNGCAPLTVQFTSTNVNTQQLIWDMNNGVTVTTTGSVTTYTYNTPGKYVPKLLLSDGVSCIVPIQGPDTITVDHIDADFSFAPGNLCQSGIVQFTDTTLLAYNPVTTRSWTFGDGGTSTAHNPSHFYTAPGTYPVTLIIGTTQGCTDTVTKMLTVLPAPTVSAGPGQTLCQGQTTSVQLQASGATSYSWTPATGLSCTTCPNPVATPSATTAYTVIGTAGNGCADTNTVIVTVAPLPVVSAGADQTICSGAFAQLQATGAVSYTWSPAAGLSCTNCPNPSAGPTTTATYIVTGTDGNGCIRTDTVDVNVSQLPTVSAGANQTICPGASAQLQATGAMNYTWSPATGLSCTNCPNPVATPGTTTTYTVVGSGGAANNCSNTAQVTVNISTLPTVSAGPNQAICAGSAAQLQASGGVSYTWSPGTGLSCTNCANPTASPTTTTTYTVTGSNSIGCTNAGQMTVTVNPLPTIQMGPDPSICQGSSVQLAVAGATSYIWSPATGLSCTSCSNPSASPAGTTTYTVTGTDANGCSNSGQVTVNVNNNPSISATTTSNIICAGGTTQLQASGGTNYSWSPATGLSCTNCANPVASPSVTTTYVVTGGNGAGCSDTAMVTINVNPLPPINAGANQSICLGSSVQMQGSGAASYTWSPATGLSCTTCPAPVANPTVTTTYTLTGTSASGCVNSSQVTVTVNALPVISVSNDQTTCLGISVPLQASGAFAYTWTPASGLSCTNCSNPAANPTGSTTYTVVGMDANGCADTDQVIVNVNPLPVVDAGPDRAICNLNSVMLQATGASTYSWSPGGSLSCTSCPNPTAAPNAPTTYTVTGTDLNGCANTDIVTVSIHPQPQISAGADQTVCRGQSVQLQAAGAQTYFWSPANGLSCTSCPNPTSTPSGDITYTVIGTDINGCTDSDKVNLTVVQMQPFIIGPGDTICEGESAYLNAAGGDQFLWIPATGLSSNSISNPVATPEVTTTYTVIIKQGVCFSDTGKVTVAVHPKPDVNAGPDQNIVAGSSVHLFANATHTDFYLWSPSDVLSCAECMNPVATPLQTTNFKVVVSNEYGCRAEDYVTIFITCDNTQVFLPNTFTPNGDGNNDRFFAQGKGISTIQKFRVYSRWGELLYEAQNIQPNDASKGWDGMFKGEILKPDVYVYVIDATCFNGSPMQLKGDISIIR